MSAVNHNRVLVIGAGIAGMETALLLAETGVEVYLLDKEPGIGGSLHLLDYTFPTDSCGLCYLEPYLSPRFCPTFESARHPNIHLIPYAEVEALEGQAGAFTARILHKPRYVYEEKCILCNRCAEVCPEERPHPYEGRISPLKAIYRPHLRAIPPTYVIDMNYCTRCGRCVEVCPTAAIDLDMKPRTSELSVASVVIAAGYEPFDPQRRAEFGHGIFPNVLTSLEFERMVSFSGSTHGQVVRPSDGKPARKIAFIHCVGSRDPAIGNGYCSSVCCMYTAKQVTLARRRNPNLEIAVFYMDIRPIGKVYDQYIRRVQETPGVRYIRSMISGVFERHPEKDLLIRYVAEDGKIREETFDLVVLAVGFEAPRGLDRLGIKLDRWGFPLTRPDEPLKTSREGVFVAGAARRPMDIPDTVVDAAAAAFHARSLFSQPISSPYPILPSYPDLIEAEPRPGVFIFSCPELGDELDLEALRAFAYSTYGASLHVLESSSNGWERLIERARAEGLNRIVVAPCGLRPTLEVHQKLGTLGPYEIVPLFEEAVAPLRGDRENATRRAKAIIGMALARLLYLYPRLLSKVSLNSFAPEERVVVVGAGLAGMTAALSLAQLGYRVDLVEKEAEPGGLLRLPRVVLDGIDPAATLETLVEKVKSNPLITLHLNSEVARAVKAGNSYLVELSPSSETILCGAIVVATGGKEAQTTQYLRGSHPKVITQLELEKLLKESTTSFGRVAMIQCVGSRDDSHPYCSRVCCYNAVKNALILKEANPDAEICVFYRDVVTFGQYEELYTRAREKGVIFIPYTPDNKPEVKPEGEDKLLVSLKEPTAGEIKLEVDWLVLSVGIEPGDNASLAEKLGVKLDEFGFFAEEHTKMRPLELSEPGIFVCGLAQGPHLMEETIGQARGVALKAALYLRQMRGLPETIATVNERLCSACEICVLACPYKARFMDYEVRVARVQEELCRGCGICAMVCPNGATQMRAFDKRALMAVVDAALAS
ncbi:MAG: FAD-dependent oxidoreductase [Anaerolineae bacterium]|nr:FAD-dependent oxidoreductase [Anaerolineae bacterium]MDW8101585.1 FAD-dependent oxidoreductase [Anaerolineae bacterium]